MRTSRPILATCIDAILDVCVDRTLPDTLALVTHMGFDGIELSLPHVQASGIAPEEIRELCSALGLRIVGTHNSLPEGFAAMVDGGSVSAAFAKKVEAALRVASALDAPLVTVGIGSSRNLARGWERTGAAHRYVREIVLAAEVAAVDVNVGVEVISGRTGGFLTTAAEAVAAIDAADASPRIGITLDAFQSAREGAAFAAEILDAGSHLHHIQVASRSRTAPCAADEDLRGGFAALREIGYTGAISLELKPPSSSFEGSAKPVEALGQALVALQELTELTWSRAATSALRVP